MLGKKKKSQPNHFPFKLFTEDHKIKGTYELNFHLMTRYSRLTKNKIFPLKKPLGATLVFPLCSLRKMSFHF